ncbi:hypothetical protein L7F22_023570 [Adiantum nelumboides]|nr:hypothetical protein [Adiantum nelumboides]
MGVYFILDFLDQRKEVINSPEGVGENVAIGPTETIDTIDQPKASWYGNKLVWGIVLGTIVAIIIYLKCFGPGDTDGSSDVLNASFPFNVHALAAEQRNASSETILRDLVAAGNAAQLQLEQADNQDPQGRRNLLVGIIHLISLRWVLSSRANSHRATGEEVVNTVLSLDRPLELEPIEPEIAPQTDAVANQQVKAATQTDNRMKESDAERSYPSSSPGNSDSEHSLVSSDVSSQEVTHLQEHTAELEDQLTQSRNLNNALIEKAKASEIDVVDAKLNLYKILVEAERCVEPATCDQEAIKGIWILVQRWREYKHNIARHFQAQHEANIARPSEVFPPSDLRKGKELALPERQGTELSSGDPGPSTSREAKELALSERQGTELSSGDPGPTTTSGEASVSKIFIPAPLEEFVIDPTFCSSLLLALDFISFQGIFGSIWFGIKLFFSLKRLIKKLAKEALQTVRIYAFFLKGSSSSGKTGLDSIVTRQDAQEMVKENAHLGALMSNAEELLNKLRLLTKLRRGETRLY